MPNERPFTQHVFGHDGRWYQFDAFQFTYTYCRRICVLYRDCTRLNITLSEKESGLSYLLEREKTRGRVEHEQERVYPRVSILCAIAFKTTSYRVTRWLAAGQFFKTDLSKLSDVAPLFFGILPFHYLCDDITDNSPLPLYGKDSFTMQSGLSTPSAPAQNSSILFFAEIPLEKLDELPRYSHDGKTWGTSNGKIDTRLSVWLEICFLCTYYVLSR